MTNKGIRPGQSSGFNSFLHSVFCIHSFRMTDSIVSAVATMNNFALIRLVVIFFVMSLISFMLLSLSTAFYSSFAL